MSNYVELFQTQSKEEVLKTINAALDTLALNALSDAANENALNTSRDAAIGENLMAAVTAVANVAGKARDVKRLVRDKLGMEPTVRTGTDHLVHAGVNKLIDKFKTN